MHWFYIGFVSVSCWCCIGFVLVLYLFRVCFALGVGFRIGCVLVLYLVRAGFTLALYLFCFGFVLLLRVVLCWFRVGSVLVSHCFSFVWYLGSHRFCIGVSVRFGVGIVLALCFCCIGFVSVSHRVCSCAAFALNWARIGFALILHWLCIGVQLVSALLL